MNNKKGFTLIEAVITIAVSVIVLGMIASVSYITSKISATQKQSSSSISQYAQAKLELDNFVGKFASEQYVFSIEQTIDFDNENEILKKQVKIFESGSNENIAMIEHFNGKINFYEMNKQNELELKKSANVSTFKDISFNYSNELGLLRCEVSFDKLQNLVFLINLGGAKFDI